MIPKLNAIQGEIIHRCVMGMVDWLDERGARITGMAKVQGAIVLALEDKDWKKLYKEIFQEEPSEKTDKGNGKG